MGVKLRAADQRVLAGQEAQRGLDVVLHAGRVGADHHHPAAEERRVDLAGQNLAQTRAGIGAVRAAVVHHVLVAAVVGALVAAEIRLKRWQCRSPDVDEFGVFRVRRHREAVGVEMPERELERERDERLTLLVPQHEQPAPGDSIGGARDVGEAHLPAIRREGGRRHVRVLRIRQLFDDHDAGIGEEEVAQIVPALAARPIPVDVDPDRARALAQDPLEGIDQDPVRKRVAVLRDLLLPDPDHRHRWLRGEHRTQPKVAVEGAELPGHQPAELARAHHAEEDEQPDPERYSPSRSEQVQDGVESLPHGASPHFSARIVAGALRKQSESCRSTPGRLAAAEGSSVPGPRRGAMIAGAGSTLQVQRGTCGQGVRRAA